MVAARRGHTCPVCTAGWPGQAARYCGRCGARLEHGGTARGDRDRRGRVGPTVAAGLSLALGALVAGAMAAAGSGAVGIAVPPDREDVALPAPGEVAGTPPATSATGCRPAGCARWSAPLGPGSVAIRDGTLYHLGRERLTAVDATTGAVRWATAIEGPHGAGRPAGSGVDVVDDLVVHRGHRWLRAHDAATGAVRWTTGLVPQRFPTAVWGTEEGLLVSGALQADHRGPPYAFVGLVDREHGELVWSRELSRVWPRSGTVIVWAGTGRLTVLDPSDGRARWFGAARQVGDPDPGILVEPSRGQVAVLDAHDGTTRWQRDLDELRKAAWIEIVNPDPGAVEDRLAASITVERDGGALSLTGPEGTLHVDVPARVVSAEPLVVATPHGLLALDTVLIGGTVAPSAADPATPSSIRRDEGRPG
jgi:outer membrane protein assembly factor BamB